LLIAKKRKSITGSGGGGPPNQLRDNRQGGLSPGMGLASRLTGLIDTKKEGERGGLYIYYDR